MKTTAHVIDYTKDNFSRNGQRYDLIIAVNGNHPIQDYRRALSPDGKYVAVGGSIAQVVRGIFLGPVVSRIGRMKMGFMGNANINQKDLVFMGQLLEVGKVVPVIDTCYPLTEVAEAIRYLVEEHTRGKVVITVKHSNQN